MSAENNTLFTERINAPIVFESNPLADEEEEVPSRGAGLVLLPNVRNETRTPSGNPVLWDSTRIHEALMICRAKQMMPGAIVVKRQLPGSGQDWKCTSHFYWGIIIGHNTYIPGSDYSDGYAPLKVRWIQPANHAGRAEEELFPGLLYVIHPALKEGDIRDLMRAQQ